MTRRHYTAWAYISTGSPQRLPFYLLRYETTGSFDQAIKFLIKTVYALESVTKWPSVVTTDCEAVLTKVIICSFSLQTKQSLCWRHKMKNLNTHSKDAFGTKKLSDSLYRQRLHTNTSTKLNN